jgi:alpha-1,3-rhamnosyl/mannosyltransferase
MRIGVNAIILGRRDSGVGIWTRGLIRSLDRWGGGHEYVVYHGLDAAELPELHSGRVRYACVPVSNRLRPLRIAWEQLRLARRARADGLDVLHCPSYVRPLRAGVPTVLTLHDLFALTHPQFCRRLNGVHYCLMLGPSVRRATLIHCTSHWTRRMLEEEFPAQAGKAHVVHPGVDEVFRPRAERAGRVLERYGLRAPPFLFVGVPEPKKDVATLLVAYAELHLLYGTRRKLLMVGGRGWPRGELRRAIRDLCLEGYVVTAGYVPRRELPALYRAAVALVFPSAAEGFGLPPLEAMACGTPVVCTLGTGLAESAGRAARRVPVGDHSALADAMHEVDRSPALRERLKAAGLRHAADFAWRDKAARMVRLYERAAGKP